MPSPTASRHEITICAEYGGDPARAVQALVRLLERGDAAARLAASQEQVREEQKEADNRVSSS